MIHGRDRGVLDCRLLIATAIYDQVKNLWRCVSWWFRLAAWAVIVVSAPISAWNLVTQIA